LAWESLSAVAVEVHQLVHDVPLSPWVEVEAGHLLLLAVAEVRMVFSCLQKEVEPQILSSVDHQQVLLAV
jgi:hypothetical protein